jgi:hypothetical protein
MGVETEKIEKTPWLSAIILSVFLGVFGTVWLHLLPVGLFKFYNFGVVVCVMQMTSAPFIILLIARPLASIGPLRGKINLSTLTTIYIVSQASAWFLWWDPIYNVYGRIITSRFIVPAESELLVPWFMAPGADISKQIMSGQLPVPWGEWLPSIIFWWTYQVFFALFYVSVTTILRRAWIDIEKVPFPHTMVAHQLIGKEPHARWTRPFIVGILIGAVFQIPAFMTSIFPWFPDVYGWRTVCGGGEWYLPADSPLASIAGLSAFNKHPVILAIAYLIPLSVLFSTWFFYIVYMVAVQIAFITGSYTGLVDKSGCGRAWCAPTPQYSEPYKFMAISYGGGILGLGMFYLILNRRYIMETLQAALGRLSGERVLELEKNEAMSYRMNYLLLALSSILVLTMFMVIGLGIVAAVLMLFTAFIVWIANSRVYGMAGVQFQGNDHGHVLFRFLLTETPEPMTREWAWSYFMSRLGANTPTETFTGAAMFTAFSSYKMASLTGFSNKKAFWLTLIPLIIVPLVVMVTWLQLNYSFGASKFAITQGASLTWATISPTEGLTNPSGVFITPGSEPLAPYVLLGVIIVGALSFLHARFLWFPFEPIGFIMGTTFMSALWGYWGPFLIAWVVKVLTLRIGGSKAYENYGIPIAAGFVAGYMVAILIGGTLSVIGFFVPF